MSNGKADQELLNELHTVLVKAILAEIKEGRANAPTFNVARQLLKDNGVEADLVEESPLSELKGFIVPFSGREAAGG